MSNAISFQERKRSLRGDLPKIIEKYDRQLRENAINLGPQKEFVNTLLADIPRAIISDILRTPADILSRCAEAMTQFPYARDTVSKAIPITGDEGAFNPWVDMAIKVWDACELAVIDFSRSRGITNFTMGNSANLIAERLSDTLTGYYMYMGRMGFDKHGVLKKIQAASSGEAAHMPDTVKAGALLPDWFYDMDFPDYVPLKQSYTPSTMSEWDHPCGRIPY